MRIKNKRNYYLKRKVVVEDQEGGKYPSFNNATEIQANISPASGKLQAEIYGERLNYILNMLYDGPLEIKEGDGVCVYVPKEEKPDYKVISIKRYSHLVLELEKI